MIYNPAHQMPLDVNLSIDRINVIMASIPQDFREHTVPELRTRLEHIREGLNITCRLLAEMGTPPNHNPVATSYIVQQSGHLVQHWMQVEWWMASLADEHGLKSGPVTSLEAYKQAREAKPR